MAGAAVAIVTGTWAITKAPSLIVAAITGCCGVAEPGVAARGMSPTSG